MIFEYFAVLFASASVKMCISFNFKKSYKQKKKVLFSLMREIYMIGGMFRIYAGDYTLGVRA